MKVGHFNQNSAFKKGIFLSATFCLSWCGFKQILEPQSSLQPSCVYQNNKAMQAPTKKSAPLITFTDDFDITGDSKTKEPKDFSPYSNLYFGKASRIENSTTYKTEDKVTYRSHWAPWQPPHTKSYQVKRYDTYTFARFINLPIKIVDRIELEPNQSVEYESIDLQETTQTVEQTVSVGYSTTVKFNGKKRIKIGGGIPLNLIQAEGNISDENSIGISQTMSRTVSTTRSQTVRMSAQVRKKWELDNSENNKKRIFQLNYRQKFKIYFTTEYDITYNVMTWGTGVGKLDENFDYIRDEYLTPVRTVFFLIPASDPTIGFTTYQNNAQGIEVAVIELENNVIYA